MLPDVRAPPTEVDRRRRKLYVPAPASPAVSPTTTRVSNSPSDDYCGILGGYFEARGNGEGDEADASSDDASRRGEVVAVFRLIA